MKEITLELVDSHNGCEGCVFSYLPEHEECPAESKETRDTFDCKTKIWKIKEIKNEG